MMSSFLRALRMSSRRRERSLANTLPYTTPSSLRMLSVKLGTGEEQTIASGVANAEAVSSGACNSAASYPVKTSIIEMPESTISQA